jgi:hypothetical protein
MRRPDLLAPRQVSDRPRQLQHPVISPRRQVHLAHRRPHQALTRPIQLAVMPDICHSHICVANHARRVDWRSPYPAIPCFRFASPIFRRLTWHEPPPLSFARRFHPRPSDLRRLPQPVIAQLLVIHARHFDMDIDPVQQWPRYSLLLFGHC